MNSPSHNPAIKKIQIRDSMVDLAIWSCKKYIKIETFGNVWVIPSWITPEKSSVMVESEIHKKGLKSTLNFSFWSVTRSQYTLEKNVSDKKYFTFNFL